MGGGASSTSFYSYLQTEIAHTSTDVVTIVTRRKPKNAAASCLLLEATTLKLRLMDTDYSQGDQALNDIYPYKMPRDYTLK